MQINLNQASPSEGRAFVNALIDRQPNRLDDAFRERLFRHTQGQPLFTVEMLNSMQESGKLVRDPTGMWVENPQTVPSALPARVEAVIEQRLRRLSPELVELLGLASVEGEWFTAEVLADLAGQEPRSVLQRLARDLEQRYNLVRELGEVQVGEQRLTRFQFRHLLFQEYLYGQLSPGEKRRLHREVAQALEKIAFGKADTPTEAKQASELFDQFGPGLVHHFWLGEMWDKAAEYAFQMGQQSRRRYAMRAAIAYFEQALRALDQLAAAPDAAIFDALLGWEEAAFQFQAL